MKKGTKKLIKSISITLMICLAIMIQKVNAISDRFSPYIYGNCESQFGSCSYLNTVDIAGTEYHRFSVGVNLTQPNAMWFDVYGDSFYSNYNYIMINGFGTNILVQSAYFFTENGGQCELINNSSSWSNSSQITGFTLKCPVDYRMEDNFGLVISYSPFYNGTGTGANPPTNGLLYLNSLWYAVTEDSASQIETAIGRQTNEIKDQINSQIEEDKKQHEEFMNSDINDEDKELPDDSKYQDYNDKEQALLDKTKEADMNVLSIGIDTNSSNFVWDNLTNFIKTNSTVFGMYIAILSIGIIKMALGR